MVESLIEEVTRPEAEASAESKSAARERLLAAAAKEAKPTKRRRLPIGGRGLAVMAALLIVPAGAAVATEVASDGEDFKSLAECPDLAAAMDAQGVTAKNLMLAHCPAAGAEVDNTISLLVEMQERRANLEAVNGEDRVTVIEPSVYYREQTGLDGIAGEAESRPIPQRRAEP